LRYLLAGESHGPALVGILEGFPSGLVIKESMVNEELARRLSGFGRGERALNIEKDQVEFLSGFWKNHTLGSPISFVIRNKDFELRKGKSAQRWSVPRPGHADLPGMVRYGFDDAAPVTERSSARSTAAVVAAGACAKALLGKFGITVLSHVPMVAGIKADNIPLTMARLKKIKGSKVLRCLDAKAEKAMVAAIKEAMDQGVTLGGEFEVAAFGLPVGLGTYTHPDRRLDATLSADVMGIPAVKAVSIGQGLEIASIDGQHAHDEIFPAEDYPATDGMPSGVRPSHGGKPTLGSGFVRTTNRAGGLEGGITNGETLLIRGFVKPITSQRKRLQSVNVKTGKAAKAAWVRSDTSVVPAAGVVAEAVVAWRLACELTSFLGSAQLDVMLHRWSELG
jgi:chorismate synthase